MKNYKSVFDYLTQTIPSKWDIETCLNISRAKNASLSSVEINIKVQDDLTRLAEKRPQLAEKAASFKQTLKAFQRLHSYDHPMTTSKIADQWVSHGNVTFNQLGNQSTPSTPAKRKPTDHFNLGTTAMENGNKKYCFTPQIKPSTSTQKPRITAADCNQLNPLYAIKISEENIPDTPVELIEEYERNKDDQASNGSLRKRAAAFDFLKEAIDQPIDNLRQFLWTHGHEIDIVEDDKKLIDLMRLVLTDFWATAVKPEYPSATNERTPFVESMVPIFKYLSAVMGTVAFVWCEKGLSICMPECAKLMDGIGTTLFDKTDRILIESSCQVDGLHTEEGTLKLLKYTSVCLQEEKGRYQQASRFTFAKRRLFGVQVVGHEITLLSSFVSQDRCWACLWERSALIPNRWNQRKYWFQAFELIARLMNMLQEQELVTQHLISEHNGLIHVPKEDTLRSHHRKYTSELWDAGTH